MDYNDLSHPSQRNLYELQPAWLCASCHLACPCACMHPFVKIVHPTSCHHRTRVDTRALCKVHAGSPYVQYTCRRQALQLPCLTMIRCLQHGVSLAHPGPEAMPDLSRCLTVRVFLNDYVLNCKRSAQWQIRMQGELLWQAAYSCSQSMQTNY